MVPSSWGACNLLVDKFPARKFAFLLIDTATSLTEHHLQLSVPCVPNLTTRKPLVWVSTVFTWFIFIVRLGSPQMSTLTTFAVPAFDGAITWYPRKLLQCLPRRIVRQSKSAILAFWINVFGTGLDAHAHPLHLGNLVWTWQYAVQIEEHSTRATDVPTQGIRCVDQPTHTARTSQGARFPLVVRYGDDVAVCIGTRTRFLSRTTKPLKNRNSCIHAFPWHAYNSQLSSDLFYKIERGLCGVPVRVAMLLECPEQDHEDCFQ
ncbi:hypothetical protein HBH53_129960 [Parastagonospora nodorum]|nr:hypothetical protein HBH53_129960 [Parastagonospora nodorum]KAH4001494.1 hypothetical protein HBI10_089690 [Parastagonospora nodorum]KAH4027412.1 hypothetical protein HBI13_058710 [Parastagonospora nodorum]KAH4390139.1 hypothetical protein HBH97_048570 [Parastagonospora nodorum]KAH4415061.1 hypothetical protein HBH99_067390 [Parastagonospora nodorum]